MNFLSHYYLDEDGMTPPFLVGVVMPDLLRDFSRNYKKNIIHSQPEDDFGRLIKEGVERHIETDAVFHDSVFFNEGISHIKEVMNQHGLPSILKRRYFVAHLILEMMIDRLLIKQIPGITVQFYHCLDMAPEDKIKVYLEQSGLKRKIQEFFYIFNRFKRYRYLSEYSKIDGLAAAVLRVYALIVPEQVTAGDQRALQEMIGKLDSYLEGRFLSVFGHIKSTIG